MTSSTPIKPTHKAILAYCEKLQGYGAHSVSHEMALLSVPFSETVASMPATLTVAPKGQPQISPGHRPGIGSDRDTCALKGRNR